MTNAEFDKWWFSLSDTEKLALIAENCRRIDTVDGKGCYTIDGSKWNLERFLYQVLYEKKTGRN